jgi:multidrug efflux pump subunit AcrB
MKRPAHTRRHRAVKAALPTFKKAIPEDVDVQLAFDQSGCLSTISGLVREAIWELLTGLVVLLFLRDWPGVDRSCVNIPFARSRLYFLGYRANHQHHDLGGARCRRACR